MDGPERATLAVLAVMPGITPDAGAERSFADAVPGLVHQGIEVHLALLTRRNTLAPDLEAAGATVWDLSDAAGPVRQALAIRRLIRRLRPAVVHATLHDATIPAQMATPGTSTPMLVTWANTSYTPEHVAQVESPIRLRIVQLAELVLARVSRARFHAVTSGVARVNRRMLAVPAGRVYVAERGRDPQKYDVEPDAAERTRRALALPDDARIVLAVGRQDLQKAYDQLLLQFERLAAVRDDVHLVVAGREGSATPALQDQLATMHHADRVRFLGHRSDVPELLAAADVIACSSLREGAAGALIEAMATSTPIACVELDGLDGVLVHEHNALVVPRPELAGAIARLLDDGDLARRLAREARRTFEQRFTLDRFVDDLARIYRQTAFSRNGGPRS